MEVVCRLGAHCTEGNRIQKTLLKNRSDQLKRGVLIPDPIHYARSLNRSSRSSHGRHEDELLDEQTKAEIAAAIPDRLVFSSERFFGLLRNTLKQGQFYASAEEKLKPLIETFPNSNFNVFLVIRDPATFFPALLNRSKSDDLLKLTDGADPRDFLWSELLERLSIAFPELSFTVCCFEDLPFLWGEFIRELISVPLNQKIEGAFDLFADFMPKEGMKRFRQYLAKHSDMNELQKRRIMAAFLDKYAIEEKLYEPVSEPGWDEVLISALSEIYDDGAFRLNRLPNVKLLSM